METLEYSGFVHSLGMQWFLPSIQAAVDFIEKHRSVSRVVGNVHRELNCLLSVKGSVAQDHI